VNSISKRIVYQSDACIVVNKLPGEAVEGARDRTVDLPCLLAQHTGGNQPVAVHRLDVPVSGCCLFARVPETRAFLSAAFAKSLIEKRYWAIVEKPPSSIPPERELLHYIQIDLKHNKSVAYTEASPGRKKALMRYQLVGSGERYLFLEIELLSGRHHQIRAQLARECLRVKGDLKYGARRSEPNGGIRLHAHLLAFPDPSGNGKTIRASALPPLMDRLWEAFVACIAETRSI
jgi:23S rRNA pseudouridine1911/1915/1917 synthase